MSKEETSHKQANTSTERLEAFVSRATKLQEQLPKKSHAYEILQDLCVRVIIASCVGSAKLSHLVAKFKLQPACNPVKQAKDALSKLKPKELPQDYLEKVSLVEKEGRLLWRVNKDETVSADNKAYEAGEYLPEKFIRHPQTVEAFVDKFQNKGMASQFALALANNIKHISASATPELNGIMKKLAKSTAKDTVKNAVTSLLLSKGAGVAEKLLKQLPVTRIILDKVPMDIIFDGLAVLQETYLYGSEEGLKEAGRRATTKVIATLPSKILSVETATTTVKEGVEEVAVTSANRFSKAIQVPLKFLLAYGSSKVSNYIGEKVFGTPEREYALPFLLESMDKKQRAEFLDIIKEASQILGTIHHSSKL